MFYLYNLIKIKTQSRMSFSLSGQFIKCIFVGVSEVGMMVAAENRYHRTGWWRHSDYRQTEGKLSSRIEISAGNQCAIYPGILSCKDSAFLEGWHWVILYQTTEQTEQWQCFVNYNPIGWVVGTLTSSPRVSQWWVARKSKTPSADPCVWPEPDCCAASLI